jgi:hypothetical protein
MPSCVPTSHVSISLFSPFYTIFARPSIPSSILLINPTITIDPVRVMRNAQQTDTHIHSIDAEIGKIPWFFWIFSSQNYM